MQIKKARQRCGRRAFCLLQCSQRNLHKSLCHHGFCDFGKACDICAGDVVAGHAVFFGGVVDVGVDVFHDVLEFGVGLFECPRLTLAVLCHFKTGNRDAAGVCGLAGQEDALCSAGRLRRLRAWWAYLRLRRRRCSRF